MADPTNARLRDHDIPVIMPRIAFKELPPLLDDDGVPADPVTTTTCVASAAPAATAAAASTGVPAPVVKLGLPAGTQRKASRFRHQGLAFTVESDKTISDVEVRVVELLSKGRKRPLGVALALAPGKKSAKVVVTPTEFAAGKLRLGVARRKVRAVAIVTAQDGSIGHASADFTLGR